MMTIPWNEGNIQRGASEQSYGRGESYFHGGAVTSLVRRGNEIQAQVEGSAFEPYQVSIDFDEGGITRVFCSCPYDWGGWCKHIVAALLACLREPESINERPPLEKLLEEFDQQQLKKLLLNLAAGNTEMVNAIESQLALLQAVPTTETTSRSRQTAVDPKPIRRQIQNILHSLDRMRPSEAYWHIGGTVDQVRQLLNQVDDFILAGDGQNALIILEAITDEYVSSWYYLDDSDGFAGELFDELGIAWTRVVVTADLPPAERQKWISKFKKWQDRTDDYGLDPFDTAIIALEQGWDHPPLQRILQGETREPDLWDFDEPWLTDSLTCARLDALERQGRHQEYLHLTEAEAMYDRHAIMLARLGRTQEAVEAGLNHLSTANETLALAKTLREQEEIASALRIGEHGLSLGGSQQTLAPWLRDLAEGVGNHQLALQAAIVAVQAEPSLDAYLKVQELAGERWAKLQSEILTQLRQASYPFTSGPVDIFLHENLADDAIAAVKQGSSYDLLGRVMDAVVEQRPDWVIQAARQEAERIINPGKAKHYHHAVSWLAKVRAGYQAAGREADWEVYLGDIRAQHGRKYKLMGMIEEFSE